MLDQISEGIDLTVRIDISCPFFEAINLISSHIVDTAFMTADVVISKDVVVGNKQGTDSCSYQFQTNLKATGSGARNDGLFRSHSILLYNALVPGKDILLGGVIIDIDLSFHITPYGNFRLIVIPDNGNAKLSGDITCSSFHMLFSDRHA